VNRVATATPARYSPISIHRSNSVSPLATMHNAPICTSRMACGVWLLADQIGGSSRACHLTADHAPRSAAAGRRSIKPQQVDCKDGCQGLPLGALEHEDATNLNAAIEDVRPKDGGV